MRAQSISMTEVSTANLRCAPLAMDMKPWPPISRFEQLGRVGEVDLVDVVVDGATLIAGEVGIAKR